MKLQPTSSDQYAIELAQQQKAHKHLSNRIRGAFSFKKVVTFYDYLIHLGYTPESCAARYTGAELQHKLTIDELNEHLYDKDISQRVKLWLRYNPPAPDTYVYETLGKDTLALSVSLVTEHTEQTTEEDDNEYGLAPRILKDKSGRNLVNLYYFQKKAAKEILDKLFGFDVSKFKTYEEFCAEAMKIINFANTKRGQLLVSATGSGKTFIIGEVIRRLIDSKFIKQSFSPWPIVYVTKASIVEQTKRVLRDQFGIDIVKQCIVINIDQLRSTFGELYIEEKVIVQDGNSFVSYHWRPIIHPLVFLLDECQSAKNPDSTQSKIIQALSEIKEKIFIIFISATPFTRVSESKAWILNCHIEIDNE